MNEIFNLPAWAQKLIKEKTPFLASDPDLTVIAQRETRVSFRARGFIYTADQSRQQII